MSQIPTVKIRRGDSYCIINESDMQPEYVLWEDAQEAILNVILEPELISVDPPCAEMITESPEIPAAPAKYRGWPKGKPRKPRL